MSNFINLKRRNGKTTMLIHTAYVTGYLIIVCNIAQQRFVRDQANKMGLESVQVYTLKDWKSFAGHSCYYNNGGDKVLIDEAQEIIAQALREFIGADAVAVTLSLPMLELPTSKDKTEEAKTNDN